MRSDNQFLGLGLAIGFAVGAALLLVILLVNSVTLPAPALGAIPSRTAPPPQLATTVPSPTVAPTFTSIPPSTSSPNIPAGIDLGITPTADPIADMILAGEISYSGPLPSAQQVRLYTASLSYAQTTVADSVRASKEINGVGYGDPTNICGPLAIAILRDAGVIPDETIPHDYWLLDPRQPPDKALLAAAFPSAQFEHTETSTPLNEMDWKANPLHPGDFMFIWHGSWGNFDHMLVVSRVDRLGRAYAVTNFGTPDGYIIAETMLYDPNDPQAGIFHTWTRARDQILGSTGFGGFELWRKRAS
jgi:hypothetical protein